MNYLSREKRAEFSKANREKTTIHQRQPIQTEKLLPNGGALSQTMSHHGETRLQSDDMPSKSSVPEMIRHVNENTKVNREYHLHSSLQTPSQACLIDSTCCSLCSIDFAQIRQYGLEEEKVEEEIQLDEGSS